MDCLRHSHEAVRESTVQGHDPERSRDTNYSPDVVPPFNHHDQTLHHNIPDVLVYDQVGEGLKVGNTLALCFEYGNFLYCIH